MTWYLKEDGKTFGPIKDKDLPQLAKEGTITQGSLVQREGDDEWVSAGALEILTEAFRPKTQPCPSCASPTTRQHGPCANCLLRERRRRKERARVEARKRQEKARQKKEKADMAQNDATSPNADRAHEPWSAEATIIAFCAASVIAFFAFLLILISFTKNFESSPGSRFALGFLALASSIFGLWLTAVAVAFGDRKEVNDWFTQQFSEAPAAGYIYVLALIAAGILSIVAMIAGLMAG